METSEQIKVKRARLLFFIAVASLLTGVIGIIMTERPEFAIGFVLPLVCLIDMPNILIVWIKQYQVVKVKSKNEYGTEQLEFQVQRYTYNAITNKFVWETVKIFRQAEGEGMAKKYVDAKFDENTEPTEEVIYKKP